MDAALLTLVGDNTRIIRSDQQTDFDFDDTTPGLIAYGFVAGAETGIMEGLQQPEVTVDFL